MDFLPNSTKAKEEWSLVKAFSVCLRLTKNTWSKKKCQQVFPLSTPKKPWLTLWTNAHLILTTPCEVYLNNRKKQEKIEFLKLLSSCLTRECVETTLFPSDLKNCNELDMTEWLNLTTKSWMMVNPLLLEQVYLQTPCVLALTYKLTEIPLNITRTNVIL